MKLLHCINVGSKQCVSFQTMSMLYLVESVIDQCATNKTALRTHNLEGQVIFFYFKK